jgi:hypothetical protein
MAHATPGLTSALYHSHTIHGLYVCALKLVLSCFSEARCALGLCIHTTAIGVMLTTWLINLSEVAGGGLDQLGSLKFKMQRANITEIQR